MQHKEHELDQMKSVVSSKEQEILILKQQGTKVTVYTYSLSCKNLTATCTIVADLEKLQEKLALNEQELQNAR